jgi:hypothetical protein
MFSRVDMPAVHTTPGELEELSDLRRELCLVMAFISIAISHTTSVNMRKNELTNGEEEYGRYCSTFPAFALLEVLIHFVLMGSGLESRMFSRGQDNQSL